jgi:hypothetical protein
VSTSCLWLSATWSRAEGLGASGSKPGTRDSKIHPAPRLKLTTGREIVAELDQIGLFQPTRGFYAGHMGKIYDAAMAVVSRNQQYVKLGDDDRYLDPTTEAHESLHAMSSLIRRARGWAISQGYDVIYVGNGEFAAVRVGPGVTKSQVSSWLPRQVKNSEIVKTHMTDPAFMKSNVALILEELAYHLLDGKIGLENHVYMEQKLGITTAVTVPAAEWSVVALATATMLDGDPKGFRRREDRVEFNLLVKRLVEESVTVYSRGMNCGKYGLLANLSPELRSQFTFLLTEDSRQASAIRDFAARTFGKNWLSRLVNQVETARQATDSSTSNGIFNPRGVLRSRPRAIAGLPSDSPTLTMAGS